MDAEAQVEARADQQVCPQCGAEEDGFFCRNCGALLRGEEMVLCPRCHQIVPDGDYCNRCGQSLTGLALHLKQLALAGDAFWVTSEPGSEPAAPEETVLEPDESVSLAAPELPDWLQELPTETAPVEVESRIYPALRPIAPERRGSTRSTNALTVAILFLLALMVGLMILVVILMVRGGV